MDGSTYTAITAIGVGVLNGISYTMEARRRRRAKKSLTYEQELRVKELIREGIENVVICRGSAHGLHWVKNKVQELLWEKKQREGMEDRRKCPRE